MLFFEYFSNIDSQESLDAFRQIRFIVKDAQVDNAEIKIDEHSGKEVVSFSIKVTLQNETIYYVKSHKDIKKLVQENGQTCPKLKYLTHD